MGLKESTHLDEPIGHTVGPLAEHAASVLAARMVPHPMEGSGVLSNHHGTELLSAQPGRGSVFPAAGPTAFCALATPQAHAAYDDPREAVPVGPAPAGWPDPMGEPAFQGLAGEFVRLTLPSTEADPAALLLAFLVGVGCIMGRGPHLQVDGKRHGVNLFSVFIGETAKGRKGTATNRATAMLLRVDPGFMSSRYVCGLSSGEGLIEAVRDPREEHVPIKAKGGGAVRFDQQVVDNGVADKRLLVMESEFGSVLQQSGREGNILSSVLRACWDSDPLGIIARSNKDRCREPHIAMIGNVTAEELRRLLTTNDRANGFGNRILWCCTRRSKLLALGGPDIDEAATESLAARIRAAVEAASQSGRMHLEAPAARAYKQLYAALAEGASGLFGAMTARAEPQVLRLALLYALLDRSSLIRIEHLRAAQEVWGYCEESVRFTFGDALGDETADAILKTLKGAPQGQTLQQIHRSFGSHKSAAELSRALKLLDGRGLVKMEQEATAGAPVTRWSLRA